MNSGALNSTIDEKTVELIEGLTPEKRGAARVWYGIGDFVRRKPLGAIGAIILFAFSARRWWRRNWRRMIPTSTIIGNE